MIYGRLSKNRNGLSTNTKIQVAECREELNYFTEDRGQQLEIVTVFEEDDVSASRYSKKPRPLYEQMLELVRANKVDQIWATEPERLLRRPDEMSTLIDLAEATDLRELRFTSDEGYNLTTPDGIHNARGSAARGERESRKISVRTKRKQADRARQGLPHGGRKPYGFADDHITHVPCEMTVWNQMADMRIAGKSSHDIEAWADKNHVHTNYGKRFTALTITTMLQNVRYTGIRTHKGTQYPAVWEPACDKVKWERLQLAIRLSRERHPAFHSNVRYMLTGLLECGACGGRLNGETKRDPTRRPRKGENAKDVPAKELRRTYQCRGCLGVTRGAIPLEHYVREEVLTRLETPDLAELLATGEANDGELAALLDKRSDQQQRLDELVKSFGKLGLSLQDLAVAKRSAQDELASIQKEIDALTRSRHATAHVPVGQTLREAWHKSDSDAWRRQLLELVVEKVIVNPGSAKPFYIADVKRYRFAPNLIDIVYKC